MDSIRVRIHNDGNLTLMVGDEETDETTLNDRWDWEDAGIPIGVVLEVTADTQEDWRSLEWRYVRGDTERFQEYGNIERQNHIWLCTETLIRLFGEIPDRLYYKEVTP